MYHLPPLKKKVRHIYRTFLRHSKSWHGGSSGYLLGFSLLIAVFLIIPLVYAVINALQADLSRWVKLLDVRVPILMWKTLSLVALVTFLSIILGFSLSWLVVRRDLPGQKYWQWLLALPLLIPSYVGAMCYISIFGPSGLLKELLGMSFIEIYGFWGAAFTLTMFTYPYVYLITLAALKKINRNYEEVGLSVGLTYREVFIKIIIPLIRPAIGAGGILVALYALSDFGTVTMLRYSTFTSAIYFQIGSYDQQTAAMLSTVLIVTTLFILFLETKTREKQLFYQTSGVYRKPEVIPLGQWKWPAFLGTTGVFIFSTVIPLGVLVHWSVIGISRGALNVDFWGYAFNSFYLSLVAAVLCVFLALPIIYLNARYPSIISSIAEKAAYAGFSLPGVIVALGIIFIFNRFIPLLYNTAFMVVTAYIIRFLPKAMQAESSSIQLVATNLDEAGRSLGYKPWQVIQKIILPNILPGIGVAGVLVFVSSMKELPATLLLRPPGMDTLPVRVWLEASEHFYYQAAPAALLLILISTLSLKWILKRY